MKWAKARRGCGGSAIRCLPSGTVCSAVRPRRSWRHGQTRSYSARPGNSAESPTLTSPKDTFPKVRFLTSHSSYHICICIRVLVSVRVCVRMRVRGEEDALQVHGFQTHRFVFFEMMTTVNSKIENRKFKNSKIRKFENRKSKIEKN